MEHEEENPDAILILDDVRAISAKWEKNHDVYTDDVKIIGLSESKDLSYVFDPKPKVNSIYFKHPSFNEMYLPITTDKHEIQREKLSNISHLCGILGATSFKSI